jgi:hypothetical protein
VYSRRALQERRCTGMNKNGQPCRAYAAWGDIRQRCPAHGGRRRIARGSDRAPSCGCGAYGWPHRPGGGLCQWPDPPEQSSPTKRGTRSPAGEQWKRDKRLARRFAIDPSELRRDPALAALLRLTALLSRFG